MAAQGSPMIAPADEAVTINDCTKAPAAVIKEPQNTMAPLVDASVSAGWPSAKKPNFIAKEVPGVQQSSADALTISQASTAPSMASQGSPDLSKEKQAEPICSSGVPLTVTLAPKAVPIADASVAKTFVDTSGATAKPPPNESTFIVQQCDKVLRLGGYVAPVLQCRYLQPVTQKAEPYVKAGIQKAAPYVESVISRTTPYAEGTTLYVQGLATRVSQASGQVVQTIRAAPGQAYRSAVTSVSSAVQTLASLPTCAYQTAVKTASRTTQAIKAAPEQVQQRATITVQSIKSTPGNVYRNALARTTPIAQSAAKIAQPYVHCTVGVVTPYVESTIANQRVQALYQSRIVQGGIGAATPYMQPVATHPTIEAITKPVLKWARPRASTN